MRESIQLFERLIIESLEEIWFSPKHVRLTRDLAAGRRDDHPLCSQCPRSPTGRPAPGPSVRIVPRNRPVPSDA